MKLSHRQRWPMLLGALWLAQHAVLAAAHAALLLPGFEPLQLTGTTVLLGAKRAYSWDGSLLPRVTTSDEPLVQSMSLVATLGGVEHKMTATDVQSTGADPDRVTIVAQSAVETVSIVATTVVEYDGLATVTLAVSGQGILQSLDLTVDLANTPATRMMTWSPDGYRKQLRRFISTTPAAQPIRGLFDTVGFADGERGFWWISDSFHGWKVSAAAASTSSVVADGAQIRLEQHLIATPLALSSQPHTLRFAFLSTPVRATQTWRDRAFRPVRRIDSMEARTGGVHLWWPESMPHQALPYMPETMSAGVEVPAGDRKVFPGQRAIVNEIRRARGFGIERLPYFSLHAPSPLDPVVARHGEWRVQPDFISRPGIDLPFRIDVPRPWLSYNSPQVAQHLVERLLEVARQTTSSGFYFDQGAPIDSNAAQHGGWRDAGGKLHSAIDVLAIRSFYRSLAEGLLAQGKSPLLYVHNSSVPIVPAYTFVTAMVQGEEFLEDLQDLDYVKSASLNLVRTQYAPGQYGIGSVWMEQLWSPRLRQAGMTATTTKEAWIGSARYLQATRRFLALVLLHDITPWSLAPVEQRRDIYSWIDLYRKPGNDFVGYWSRTHDTDPQLPLSYYVDQSGSAALLVIVNRADTDARMDLGPVAAEIFGNRVHSVTARRWPATDARSLAGKDQFVQIDARDFSLVELKVR